MIFNFLILFLPFYYTDIFLLLLHSFLKYCQAVGVLHLLEKNLEVMILIVFEYDCIAKLLWESVVTIVNMMISEALKMGSSQS